MRDSPAAPVANHQVSVCIGEIATVRTGDILVHPIDFDAHIRGIPDDVYVKGFFAKRFAAYVGATRPEAFAQYMALHPGHPSDFSEIPGQDLFRGVYDAARLSHPDLPVAEALRRVGWSVYETFLGSLLGRMLFRAMGKDLDAIYRFGPRAFAYSGNSVLVRYTRLGDRHFRYDYDLCFAWLDSYQVGLLEGAAAFCGHSTEMKVHVTEPYRGWIECRWF
jgi:uncharacterized protein (TIGR02265 family)